ncbi:hypothetical protein [Longimicrobium sp.]|jgi:uncharacterized protein involved in propanediol utilization|uniref:GHMP family kinase ATP-binding protein n=1 Tax=Longimicrobium sp. TaxID=2029185 RepID=UPI002F94E31E
MQPALLVHPRGAAANPAPPPLRLAPDGDGFRVGHGEIHAHHGEIVQGMFYSSDGTVEHGLVTLPCTLFRTSVRFRPLRSGPLTVEPGDRARARAAARLTLDALGRTGWGGAIRIESNVPVQWGCGSSTTDVLATIRAVADAFGAVLDPAWIAGLAVAAETASDSLMFGPGRAVLFAQRRGRVLQDLGGPLPPVRVLGFNTEGEHGVATLSLPPVPYTLWEIEAYRTILGLLRRAVERQDAALMGRVATASTLIMQRHRPKRQMPELLHLASEAGALGVQVAHSGTVAGFLFAPGPAADAGIERARNGLDRLGVPASWEFSIDPAPHPADPS